MSSPLFLIGFMACGKSTMLEALARRVSGHHYIDLDQYIEAREGMSIPDIFATRGEEAFRLMEADAVSDLCGTDAVVACGGGTPCHKKTMDAMLAAGTVVWLRCDIDTTLRRLALVPGQRPLVDGLLNDPEALRRKVEKMQALREPHYSRAHAIFDSSRLEDENQVEQTAKLFINTFMHS